MQHSVNERAGEILRRIATDPVLGPLVDSSLPIPRPLRGDGTIKLVILGQDPTVKNQHERAKIRVVLNLDRGGNLRRYITRVCEGLGLDLDRHVYATNYVKNFFVRPPTKIEELDVLGAASRYWLPLLQDELAELGDAPVIALGEPLLRALVTGSASTLVRHYWGYTRRWQAGEMANLQYLRPAQNRLERVVFPFPHEPSYRQKRFYKEQLGRYVGFVRRTASFE
jgi:hypothetical protein